MQLLSDNLLIGEAKMSFWNRQRGRVYVYVYKDGKQKALPRDKTRHLDAQPDTNVEAWVHQYHVQFEGKKYNLDTYTADRKLDALVKQFCDYLRSRKKNSNTVWMHEYKLKKYIIPFFILNDPPLTNPDSWPSKSVRLLAYLQEKKLSVNYILKCNSSLRLFWKWLQEEGTISTPFALRLRNPIADTQATPLKFTLSPDEVLTWVKSQTNPDLAIMALTGYFFSIRTFEIFGLKKSDFRAGKAVQTLECSKVMTKYKLFDRFVVNIQRQRRRNGEEFAPKVNSKGWVSCFHEEAAKLIIALIKDIPDNDFLLKYKGDWYFKLWRNEGIKDVTLKDLRRSSLYWLGHHTEFELIPLRNHARHKRAETTLLYVRRPGEELDDFTTLNLEA
jgi:hypothetical protein